MTRITTSIGATLVFGIIATSALAQQQSTSQNQPGFQASESTVRKATVQDIDYKHRTVTLRGERGNVVTVKIGEEVKNFDQIRKGDQVTAEYKELVAIAIRKSNEPPSATEQETFSSAQPGEKPAGTAIRTTQISAEVEKIDRNKREVTLRGPEGRTKKLKIGKNVERFDELTEGDQVVATYTEEFTIAVTPPEK